MAADPTPVKVRQNKKKTVIFITAAMLILAIAAGIGVKWYRDVQNRVTVSFNTNGGETVEAVTLKKGSVFDGCSLCQQARPKLYGLVL